MVNQNQLNAEADVVQPTRTVPIGEDFNRQTSEKITVPLPYIPKAISKSIKFCSRISIKIQDNFYTIEYGEEREIPNFNEVDLDKERQKLIDDCNRIVDEQAEDIYKTFIK